MLTAKTLKGNWATLLLPINSDDSIDYVRLAEEIDDMIRAVPDGIYSNGTAGELHNQTEAEFDKVQEIMAAKCEAAAVPFQIGANHPSPLISLQRMQRTVALQPAAFQVILPDWVSTGAGEQVTFYKGWQQLRMAYRWYCTIRPMRKQSYCRLNWEGCRNWCRN
ncbi:hypothetical protein [Paraflavitalea speifideaquila]|uniref:dihydrodipicolinate synthase family protein n=1 Tax=Paraflavitalea speifideaquila TaxID=3076558 RepID=UPI0028E5FCBF|nr:hypothetical protein [Paraflavitalea speifideiaquila]